MTISTHMIFELSKKKITNKIRFGIFIIVLLQLVIFHVFKNLLRFKIKNILGFV
jgi:hypothetical protein